MSTKIPLIWLFIDQNAKNVQRIGLWPTRWILGIPQIFYNVWKGFFSFHVRAYFFSRETSATWTTLETSKSWIGKSDERSEAENIEILDALNIDNITKLKQISPFLGDIDFGKSDDVDGSKVQLLLKIMESTERRQGILNSLQNNEKIELHPIEILYEILRLVLTSIDPQTAWSKDHSDGPVRNGPRWSKMLIVKHLKRLKPPKNMIEKIYKLGNEELEYPMTISFQRKLSSQIIDNISRFPTNFSKTNNGLVRLIQGRCYFNFVTYNLYRISYMVYVVFGRAYSASCKI